MSKFITKEPILMLTTYMLTIEKATKCLPNKKPSMGMEALSLTKEIRL